MKRRIIILTILLCVHFFSAAEESKVVFLTGAAGFIGSNFLEYMFDTHPEYHFLVLDALTYAGNLENISPRIRDSDRFEFFYGSVTNYKLVEMLMRRAQLVVHFAAESHVTRSICDDSTFFETDVLGTRVVMTALVKYRKSVERFIHISTSEVLGTSESEMMGETHPINPRSPYAAAKAGADRLVYAYWCTYDVPAVIVRPFNNYGPRQHLEKLIPRLISSAIQGRPLTIHGDGEQMRDWLHTLDLCKALDRILHISNFEKIKNQVFHIGSEKATSVLDIARVVLKHFNLPESRLQFIGDRPGQVHRHMSDSTRAHELLGWKSQISLEEGLKDTIDWYLKNNEHWKKMEALMYVPIYTNDDVLEIH